MSIDTPMSDELQQEKLGIGAETKLEKPAPKSPEAQNNELQAEVFDAVDQYTTNETQRRRVSESIQSAAQTRKDETSARTELEQQISAGQDVVKFRNQGWRPHKEENGNIILTSALSSEKDPTSRQAVVRVETDENFQTSLEPKRQKLESLWKENKDTEQRFGGSEKFAEIQKTVGEIRKIEQELAKEGAFKKGINDAQYNLQRVESYAVADMRSGQGEKDLSGKIKENDRARFIKEILEAERGFKEFIQTKPGLLAKREGLSQELKRLL